MLSESSKFLTLNFHISPKQNSQMRQDSAAYPAPFTLSPISAPTFPHCRNTLFGLGLGFLSLFFRPCPWISADPTTPHTLPRNSATPRGRRGRVPSANSTHSSTVPSLGSRGPHFSPVASFPTSSPAGRPLDGGLWKPGRLRCRPRPIPQRPL